MDGYNRDLRALLDLVTETSNSHDRTTQDMLIDMRVLQDGREEDAESLDLTASEMARELAR